MTRFDGIVNAAKGKTTVKGKGHITKADPVELNSPVEPTDIPTVTEERSQVDEIPKRLDVQASKQSDTQTSKSKDTSYQRTTVYLPKPLHKKLKSAALDEDREMSDIIESLVDEWLKSRDV